MQDRLADVGRDGAPAVRGARQTGREGPFHFSGGEGVLSTPRWRSVPAVSGFRSPFYPPSTDALRPLCGIDVVIAIPPDTEEVPLHDEAPEASSVPKAEAERAIKLF